MSENPNVNHQLQQLKRVVGKLKARTQDPSTPAWKKAALIAVVGTVLAAGGYEGYRSWHAAGPVEAKASLSAVEQAKPDESLRTSMVIQSCYVTSGNALLLNSKKDFKDPENLVVVVPTGSHNYTRDTNRSLVGKCFAGEVVRGTYNGRAQLAAVPGRFEIR